MNPSLALSHHSLTTSLGMSSVKHEVMYMDFLGILGERWAGRQVCLCLRAPYSLWEGQMSQNLFLLHVMLAGMINVLLYHHPICNCEEHCLMKSSIWLNHNPHGILRAGFLLISLFLYKLCCWEFYIVGRYSLLLLPLPLPFPLTPHAPFRDSTIR
jgi:hypothetical protein